MNKKFSVDILKINPTPVNDQIRRVILIIPGNPGLVNYYVNFIEQLYKECDGSTAVWAMSHSCHSSQKMDLNAFDEANVNRLDLEIEHKLNFIESEIPQNCRIHLVGHSIGCYMILSVLEILMGLKPRRYRNENAEENSGNLLSRIDKCLFLFPTVERMRISPNGRRLWPWIKYFIPVVMYFITMISWLPSRLVRKLIQWYFGRDPVDKIMIDTTVDLLTPRMFSSMLKLSYIELCQVDRLQVNIIEKLKEKLIFYFGKSDDWCPVSYAEDLKRIIPDLECHIDDQNVKHAFVLKSSETMAVKVAKLLKSSN